MRIIVRFEKGEALRYLSHLDLQRLLQRALRRAGIPLAYSQGFNPHPLLSFATALGLGQTSAAEWMEVRLEADMAPHEFLTRANAVLPSGCRFLEEKQAPQGMPALAAQTTSALYRVELSPSALGRDAGAIQAALDRLMAGPIVVEKFKKGTAKQTDIRPLVLWAQVEGVGPLRLLVRGVLTASAGLNASLFAGAVLDALDGGEVVSVHRLELYGQRGSVLPEDAQI